MSGSKYRMFKPVFGIAALAALVVVYGRTPATSTAGKIMVRLAYFPNITHAPAITGMARGDFQRAVGSGVAIDPKIFNAGPAEMEALSAGAIDIGYVGPSPAVNTFVRSHGRALKIVAGVCSGGASLVALPSAHITAIEDLGGKKVAVPQLGGTQDVSLRHFMALHGLQSVGDHGGTVQVIPLKNPDILTEFKQGALDAAWVPEPWASRLIDEAHAVRVIDERDLWPSHQFTSTVIVVRTDFLIRHRDVVRAILSAHAGEVAWIGNNSVQAAALVNGQMSALGSKSLKPAVLADAWARVSFTTDPNPASIEASAQAAVDAGYLPPVRLNMSDLIDSSARPDAR